MSIFDPESRYVRYATVMMVRDRNGREVQALTPAEIPPARELGEHLRKDGQRLDHLASRYLDDPTAFWRIARHNDALSADAVAEAPIIRIPLKE